MSIQIYDKNGQPYEADLVDGEMFRQLELKLATLGEIAVANWDDPTVGEVDKHVNSIKYKDMLHTLFVKNPKRIKELENENAKFRNTLVNIIGVLDEENGMSQAACMEKAHNYAYKALYPKII